MADVARRQKCPNCGHAQDVSIYVTGQRVRCICGLHFEVRRFDGRPTPAPRSEPSTPRASATPGAERTTTAVFERPKVPGYELEELLGRGGMGEVWRARQLSLGRTVALKLLSPELATNADLVRRFEKEGSALAALSHPNIVRIIDRGGDPVSRTYYIAMELCDGLSLRERMSDGSLDVAERLRLVAQVAGAIDSAHRCNVIHRDLKPENILIGSDGVAKIVDFGLAGVRGGPSELNLTKSATAMGTLHYMAPEQRRDARSVDERADVYSLGVILYEVLTGELPVGRFKLPSERVPGLDRRLDAIVIKSLEADPAGRTARAADLAQGIEALLSDFPRTEAGARGPRLRWLIAAAALLALVALAAGAFFARG